MASEPVASVQIEPHHTLGMNLVGTVALPSPFPAAGRIFVVRHPPPRGAKAEKAKPTYHLKIVQLLSDTHSITRFVAVDHVRLIRFNQPAEPVAPPSTAADKEVKVPSKLENEDLRKEIDAIPWEKTVKDGRGALEVELYPDQTGVVHVPEQAPVLMRHECTVTAATSVESIVGSGAFCPRSNIAHACPHQ